MTEPEPLIIGAIVTMAMTLVELVKFLVVKLASKNGSTLTSQEHDILLQLHVVAPVLTKAATAITERLGDKAQSILTDREKRELWDMAGQLTRILENQEDAKLQLDEHQKYEMGKIESLKL